VTSAVRSIFLEIGQIQIRCDLLWKFTNRINPHTLTMTHAFSNLIKHESCTTVSGCTHLLIQFRLFHPRWVHYHEAVWHVCLRSRHFNFKVLSTILICSHTHTHTQQIPLSPFNLVFARLRLATPTFFFFYTAITPQQRQASSHFAENKQNAALSRCAQPTMKRGTSKQLL